MEENKFSPEAVLPPGSTTIAPDVLLTIARLSTLIIPGVSRLSSIRGGVNRLFRRSPSHSGVRIYLKEDRLDADIYVILKAGHNIRQVSRDIQSEVARSITSIVGMEVGRINIHIEDIDFEEEIRANE
ncbi:MAG: Asp23/Gls24 family envelope stress response protein [Anaerolineales bacterium]|nr:Asp23/Gls24 family envelope stress response protein [Anaerolineales bacterium]